MPLLTLITSNGLIDISIASSGDELLLLGLKFMFVLAGFLYLLFAILVTRQVSIMSKTISTTASPRIKLLGIAHLVIAILVLIYFFIVL